MPDLDTARTRLQDALTELEARLTHIARDLADTPDRDWAEQAIEIEDDEALEHQAALVEQEIASVKGAMSRIADGTYGKCVRCGERSRRHASTLVRKRRCASPVRTRLKARRFEDWRLSAD